jgi:hypothetical protein
MTALLMIELTGKRGSVQVYTLLAEVYAVDK